MTTTNLTANVEALRIKMLYRQSRSTQLVGLLNYLIYVYLGLDLFGPGGASALAIVAITVSVGRSLIVRRFEKLDRADKGFDPRAWENIFVGGTIVKALLWGLTGALLPSGALMQQAFLAFVLAGTTAGAMVAYCTSYRTITTFLIFAVVPFALNMLYGGATIQLAMGAMLLLYVGLLLSLTRHLSTYVVDSIRLRFEKDQAMEELRAARNSFAHSTKMAALGEMAGGIAHEINNPLAIIRANAGVIRRLLRPEEINREKISEIAEKIDSTVDRIAKIVSGLRTFSREAGNDPLEDVSAREVIEQTMEFCEARFRSRGIPLEIDIPASDLLITCRRVQISQVLLNLLNNAFDAVKDSKEPWVRVHANRQGDEVSISVSDSGNGVRADIRDKIMQPFFTTKKVGEGTGLGLSIAHGIMEGHGGSLKLDTDATNTRFVMSFGPRPPLPAEVAPVLAA